MCVCTRVYLLLPGQCLCKWADEHLSMPIVLWLFPLDIEILSYLENRNTAGLREQARLLPNEEVQTFCLSLPSHNPFLWDC